MRGKYTQKSHVDRYPVSNEKVKRVETSTRAHGKITSTLPISAMLGVLTNILSLFVNPL